MNEKIIETKNFLFEKDKYIILNINSDNIFDNIDLGNIYLSDSNIIRINNKTIKEYHNDYDNPLVIEKDDIFNNYNLYINPDYYLKNMNIINNILCNYISNYKKEELSINSVGLINSKIIDSIVNNTNIKTVSLARYNNPPYILTKEDYIKFKKANIKVNTKLVSEELKEVYDDIIILNSEKKLISFYTYKHLNTRKGIYVDKELTKEELYNLKYINPDLAITLDITNYEHINEVNYRLKELGYKNKVIIKLEEKNSFNEFIFNNKLIEKDIFVQTKDLEIVKLSDYLKFEKLLYEMIKNTKDLSYFEKYIYAYNITKQFKQYRENEIDKDQSRKLYSLLINEYMVCVGYSRLFSDLLDKLGICNIDLSVNVDTSYDKVDSKKIEVTDSIPITKDGHARCYIHIVDSKYNIDGYYISDPTWDNDLTHDYYNHLAMTDMETTFSKRYLWLNEMDIFNITNINEYIEKMNKIKRDCKDYNKFLFAINRILEKIKKLDIEIFNKLSNKYNFILNEDVLNWPNNITGLVYDLGELIIKKVNNTLDSTTIFKAIENVYKNSYGYKDEDLNKKLDIVRKENEERQSKMFPTRNIIKQDGTCDVINCENKFEVRKL